MWLSAFDASFVDEIESQCRVAVKMTLYEFPFEQFKRSPYFVFGRREKFRLRGERAIISHVDKILRQQSCHSHSIIAELRLCQGTTRCLDFRRRCAVEAGPVEAGALPQSKQVSVTSTLS